PPGLALLNSVYFSDANTVWAVGHDSVILKSTDQGKEWTQVHASANDRRPLMDVLFVDATHGFAVGAYGAFLETVDAGKTWTSRKAIPAIAKPKPSKEDRGGRNARMEVEDDADKSVDEDKHLNAIIKLGEGRLFIAGEAGTMLLSNDNGKSWERVLSPYKGSYFGAILANDGSVLALGLRGNVFRAPDSTLKAWTPVVTNTKASMMSATKLADGAIVLSGLSGTLLVSSDNGRTFASVESGTIKPLATAVQGKRATLLVVGETGARDVPLAAGASVSATGSTPAITTKP
ncbi:MAG: WD40/YVTN/BNR-like repeat-containing protein, partial [Burkholderiales bacterium]